MNDKITRPDGSTKQAPAANSSFYTFNPGPGPSNKTARVTEKPIEFFRSSPYCARKHSAKQTEHLISAMDASGYWDPILAKANGEIIDGHARFEAARRLNYATVPVIIVDGLSEEQMRAIAIGLNRIPEGAEWDEEALKAELKHLIAFDADLVETTGFEAAEIDRLLCPIDLQNDLDDVPDPPTSPVSQSGDMWTCAGQRLVCGSATDPDMYRKLLGTERVNALISDPPYGCPIQGHVSQKHGEFLEGSGVTEDEMIRLLGGFTRTASAFLVPGSLVYVFTDANGMYAAITALRQARFQQKAICIWDKQAGSMGAFYRQQAEFVLVAKHGKAPHTNNVRLGRFGRNRTSVWSYPGLSQFGANRSELLKMHPTIKPVGLIADAILDSTKRNEIVLDPFLGSGTTLLAAHRVGRRGRGIELDPKYVDVAIHRLQQHTGEQAVHAASGRTFAERAARVSGETTTPRVRVRHMNPRV